MSLQNYWNSGNPVESEDIVDDMFGVLYELGILSEKQLDHVYDMTSRYSYAYELGGQFQ